MNNPVFQVNEIDEMNMETTDAFAAYLTEGSDRQMDFLKFYLEFHIMQLF